MDGMLHWKEDHATYELTREAKPRTAQDRQMIIAIARMFHAGVISDEDLGYAKYLLRQQSPREPMPYLREYFNNRLTEAGHDAKKTFGQYWPRDERMIASWPYFDKKHKTRRQRAADQRKAAEQARIDTTNTNAEVLNAYLNANEGRTQ